MKNTKMKNVNRWFKQVGPVRWYRREWLAVEVSFRNWLFFSILLKRRYFRIDIGGTVHKRSVFGNPSSVEPAWSFVRGGYGL